MHKRVCWWGHISYTAFILLYSERSWWKTVDQNRIPILSRLWENISNNYKKRKYPAENWIDLSVVIVVSSVYIYNLREKIYNHIYFLYKLLFYGNKIKSFHLHHSCYSGFFLIYTIHPGAFVLNSKIFPLLFISTFIWS